MKAKNYRGKKNGLWHLRSSRCLSMCALSAAGGLLAGFFLFPYFNRPSEGKLLQITAAAYFEFISEGDYGGAARFENCRVEEADQRDAHQLGVAYFGICSLKTREKPVDFTVAFYKTGNIAFKDREAWRNE